MCLIWSFNCIGTVSTFSDPPRKPYDALVNYLRGEHLKYGYTGYYTAYPVVFLSNEDIILSPRAGPIFLDRYEPYSRQVDKTQNACYIFFSESRTDALFAQQLQRLNTEFKKVSVGAWNVYSDLPPNIRGSITLPVTAGN
jgi:hypothetical protein